MAKTHILAIDQGTTSTRALLFDRRAARVATAQVEFAQHFPAPGRVEHEPEDIWRDTVATVRATMTKAGLGAADIAAIGITNQRETVVLWDRATGQPIDRAIVWQDRRTANRCRDLKADGVEAMIQRRTGLLLDPYFSATKIAWMLDAVPGARARAERGELAAGTIDSFLLWRLTGGTVHATDVTNASRTMLFDIHRGEWDGELCRLFDVPMATLPAVHDNAHHFGNTAADLFGASIPIAGMAGDQQAALFGQACFDPGMVKSTYGTGGFLLANTGTAAVASSHRLLTTPAYRIGGHTTYAVEGSIFVAGAAIKWLRDGIGAISMAESTAALAAQVPDDHGVLMVPAFVGLGAPHWNASARGAIFGMDLATSGAHLARAALEAVAFQTRDLVDAMVADGAIRPGAIRIDGGMAGNDWMCAFLAGMLDVPVERPADLEATARGAAFHAGLSVGLWSDLKELSGLWASGDRFEPNMEDRRRALLMERWHDAVRRTLGTAD